MSVGLSGTKAGPYNAWKFLVFFVLFAEIVFPSRVEARLFFNSPKNPGLYIRRNSYGGVSPSATTSIFGTMSSPPGGATGRGDRGRGRAKPLMTSEARKAERDRTLAAIILNSGALAGSIEFNQKD